MTTQAQMAHEVFVALNNKFKLQAYTETRQKTYGEKQLTKFDLVDLPQGLLKFLASKSEIQSFSEVHVDPKP